MTNLTLEKKYERKNEDGLSQQEFGNNVSVQPEGAIEQGLRERKTTKHEFYDNIRSGDYE